MDKQYTAYPERSDLQEAWRHGRDAGINDAIAQLDRWNMVATPETRSAVAGFRRILESIREW